MQHFQNNYTTISCLLSMCSTFVLYVKVGYYDRFVCVGHLSRSP